MRPVEPNAAVTKRALPLPRPSTWCFSRLVVNSFLTIWTWGGVVYAAHGVTEIGCTSHCKYIRNRFDQGELRRRHVATGRLGPTHLRPFADDLGERQSVPSHPGLLRPQRRRTEQGLPALLAQ